MEVKRLLFLLLVVYAISMSAAWQRCKSCRGPCQFPQKSVCFSNLATLFPAFNEPIDYIPNCCKPCCNDQLILPPLTAELPCGLGYFPSAVPLVAKYYAPALDFLTTGAYIPVASPCDCLTLAAPVNPEYAPLVKPIIL